MATASPLAILESLATTAIFTQNTFQLFSTLSAMMLKRLTLDVSLLSDLKVCKLRGRVRSICTEKLTRFGRAKQRICVFRGGLVILYLFGSFALGDILGREFVLGQRIKVGGFGEKKRECVLGVRTFVV